MDGPNGNNAGSNSIRDEREFPSQYPSNVNVNVGVRLPWFTSIADSIYHALPFDVDAASVCGADAEFRWRDRVSPE